MSEEATYATNGTATPGSRGDVPLPKRGGPKGMLPSTWLTRPVRVEYTSAGDNGSATTTTSGVLLDWFPFGPVLNIGGARTALSWERIVLVELVGD